MLKKNALRRICISTFSLLIVLLLCIFPSNETSYPEEIISINELTMPLYIKDQNGYVARTNIIKKKDNDIEYIINLLTKKSLYEKCENSEINTLDDLKVQIGIAMFNVASKNPVEPTTKVNATFAAPVDKTPNIVVDSAEGSKKKGNKNSWDILDEYAGK